MVQYHISPDSLLTDGPFISVAIAGIAGVALLDTGADLSSIDIAFAQQLQLPIRGIHESAGATGAGEYPLFDAVLEIPLLEIVVPTPLRGLPLQTLGHPWDAVIGRDVLCQFELLINGRTGLIRLERA